MANFAVQFFIFLFTVYHCRMWSTNYEDEEEPFLDPAEYVDGQDDYSGDIDQGYTEEANMYSEYELDELDQYGDDSRRSSDEYEMSLRSSIGNETKKFLEKLNGVIEKAKNVSEEILSQIKMIEKLERRLEMTINKGLHGRTLVKQSKSTDPFNPRYFMIQNKQWYECNYTGWKYGNAHKSFNSSYRNIETMMTYNETVCSEDLIPRDEPPECWFHGIRYFHKKEKERIGAYMDTISLCLLRLIPQIKEYFYVGKTIQGKRIKDSCKGNLTLIENYIKKCGTKVMHEYVYFRSDKISQFSKPKFEAMFQSYCNNGKYCFLTSAWYVKLTKHGEIIQDFRFFNDERRFQSYFMKNYTNNYNN